MILSGGTAGVRSSRRLEGGPLGEEEAMPIFDRVRAFLHRRAPLATDRSGRAADLELQVATVVLLLETAYGDAEYAPREREAILHGIEREFGIGEADALRLVESAERARPAGGDIAPMSARIAQRYDLTQRKRIAALVWKVVYADRIVDEAEEAFANHVTELTGLTREEGEEARLNAFVWFSESRPARPGAGDR
jgi:uncharacterized tellurite resistance protein B-like protein